jgi:hypothetical protein
MRDEMKKLRNFYYIDVGWERERERALKNFVVQKQ